MGQLRATREAALQSVVEKAIVTSHVPGIALAVSAGGRPPEHLFSGRDAAGRPLGADSLFTVASITKLASALLVLRLVEGGAVGLDDPLASHLPEAAAAQAGVTLRTLLSHTSGLPMDLAPTEAPPYTRDLDWPALAEACLRTPLEAPPCTRVQYSNVGYGLLAIVVERGIGQGFAAALGSLVLEPLGLEGYLGVEPPRPSVVLADVRSSRRGTELEPFNSPFWRSLGLPWGGLVTTVDGALCLVQAFSDAPAGFLRPATLAEATRNQAGDLGGGQVSPLIWPTCPWGLGPELRDAKTPHWAPAEANPDSFGHAGASGGLAWSDPAAEVAWAMLGTRTANSGWLLRDGPAIGAAILAAVDARGSARSD
jgi:beta-lactamase class C